jgi:hypothetical protein
VGIKAAINMMTHLNIDFKILSLRFLTLGAVLSFMVVVLPVQVLAQSAFDDPGARSTGAKGGDLNVVESKIDAGAVALGSSSQVVILLRNDGVKPITSGAISLYPSSNVSASVGENECIQTPLPSGAVCAIAISVKGLQPGKFRIEMLMRHDGRAKLVTSTVSGVVERSGDASADIISDLDTIPSELDFGTLKDSRPLTRSIIMRNVTSKTISIESMRINSNDQAGYSLESDCEKLLSGEACIATVTWAPQQRGPATGVLVVNHDGPTGVVSVILDGEYTPTAASQVGIFPEAVPGKGLLTASQTDIDFGNGIKSTSAITVSLVNVGDVPLEVKDIHLSNKNNGITIERSGCRKGLILNPVEACPLTLTWEPVREGDILDDVQIRHDGARGILILPVRGQADKVVNKDSKIVIFGSGDSSLLSSIPTISASEVEGASSSSIPASKSSRPKEVATGNAVGSLDGFKVTSLAKDRAIISGPGGSRVVFHSQETVIGGVLWRVAVRPNAVEFIGGSQRALLLFDHSLSFTGSNSSTTSSSSSNSSSSGDNN